MKLVGEGLAQRKVKEDDNLATLLRKFTDKPRIFCGDFKAVEKSLEERSLDYLRKIEETSKFLSGQVYLPVQRNTHETALINLASEYLRAKFNQRYDWISSDLFNIKRTEFVKSDDGSHFDANIPLFAKVDLGSEQGWKFNSEYKDLHGRRYNFSVSAGPPLMPLDAREKTRNARAYFFEIMSDMLRNPALGDITQNMIEMSYQGLGGGIQRIFDTQMYWIPKSEELRIESKVVDRDPFVAAQICGRHFLIANWDVPEEMPYKHYLAEFTERTAGK